jgi:methylmalonyl-CoA/ethylmalonyl-CoA epimerase
LIRIEHIGIAVADLEKANRLFESLMGEAHYKIERVESEKVNTSFFKIGESKIELVASESEDSAISKFISKRGEGMHHIALEVRDIHQEISRLQAAGFEFINPVPKAGADRKMIVFLHPRSTGGVLVELTQDIGE